MVSFNYISLLVQSEQYFARGLQFIPHGAKENVYKHLMDGDFAILDEVPEQAVLEYDLAEDLDAVADQDDSALPVPEPAEDEDWLQALEDAIMPAEPELLPSPLLDGATSCC